MLVPVYDIKNCGPRHRFSANGKLVHNSDKINLQNLPSRGANKNKLKRAIKAPKGYVIIDCDSSQIEARTVAWLAEQNDIVAAFANKEDVYKIMASQIYRKPENEVTHEERFVGKTCLAEGTLVLCKAGWKPIEQVTTSDLVWDGVEWVCHQGLVNNGIKKTLNVCGLWLTPDHLVWSGESWIESRYLVRSESILYRALGTAAESLPLPDTFVGYGGELAPLLYDATATTANTLLTSRILSYLKALGAHYAQKLRGVQNVTGHTFLPCLMMDTGLGCSTDYPQQSPDVTTKIQNISYTMGRVVYAWPKNGEPTELRFSNTYKHLLDGITLPLRWIVSTLTKGMNRVILGLFQNQRTCGINAESLTLNRKLPVYDLACAGPRNRFTVLTKSGPLIVHNCVLGAGYGMGGVKFQAQLKVFGVSVPLDECKRIINVYRDKAFRIKELWGSAQKALTYMLMDERMWLGREGVLMVDGRKGILLPSGYYLNYEGLATESTDSGEQFTYISKKGKTGIKTKIYGGKVVENICQAVARCVIAEQMLEINKRYRPVLTVHDAVAVVAPKSEADEARAYVEQCMRWVPKWAVGLPLDCESGMAERYGDC